MRIIEAGDLRHRIDIQQNTPAAANAFGERAPVWTSILNGFWARIEPATGRVLEYARSFSATVSHKITMRWQPEFTVNPTMRVVYAGRVFQINGVVDVEERRTEWNLFCTELVVT